MATRVEIEQYAAEQLHVADINDYCPNGVQVEGGDQIRKLGVAVTASLSVIERACALECDALLVHHGLFWKGDDYTVTGTKRAKLQLLLENDISLMAYHLPLDMSESFGNNWGAARALGWKSLEPFGESGRQWLGVRGQVASTSAEQMQAQLEDYFGHAAHYAPGEGAIENVALISGGAHKYISEAAASGIDCFITGSFDEPVWHIAREEGVHFFAMGHAATEWTGVKLFAENLADTFGIEWVYIEENNPF